MQELWKVINDWPYEISNRGRVRRINGNLVTQHKDTNGYWCVRLSKGTRGNTTVKFRSVHRLLAISFIPNPSNKTDVNHKNGIKSDNTLSNLEWMTHSENMKHAYSVLGRIAAARKKVSAFKNGVFIKEYPSSLHAAKDLGIASSGIREARRGGLKTFRGYTFK